MIYKVKKKLLLSYKGPFILLFHNLISFKVMGNVLDGFFLINLGSIPITLRVGIGPLSKNFVGSFRVDGLS